MSKSYIFLIVILISSISISCEINKEDEIQPNVLWIVLEDTSPLIACYGDSSVPTPNIDKLAQNGVVFTNAFMPAPVCSASRSSMITGMMSTTLGLHNHHSSRTEESAIYLPDSIQTIPELFKQAGYFTFNNGKDDYNFTYDRRDLYDQDYSYHPLYGKSGDRYKMEELKDKTPFFGQIQMYGGKEIFSSKFKDRVESPIDRADVNLPPFLPNHPSIIEEYANHYDAIQITDRRFGEIIENLKEAGLLENTIVLFFSDHGMRLTRHKQFLYDGGTHVPLIIADFTKSNGLETNTRNEELISGLDLGPISLALAGIPIPEYMEGIDVLGEDVEEREYVISTRDRCDFSIDRIRSVRTKDFKYIRNFMTDRPYMQTSYMDVDGVEFVKVMKQLSAEGKLDEIQNRLMLNERPAIELYDLKNDPFEIHNLANDESYTVELNKLASILDQWILETNDQGQYPENPEALKLMLGIWGDHAENPEYDTLRVLYPELPGSLFPYKNQGWKASGE